MPNISVWASELEPNLCRRAKSIISRGWTWRGEWRGLNIEDLFSVQNLQGFFILFYIKKSRMSPFVLFINHFQNNSIEVIYRGWFCRRENILYICSIRKLLRFASIFVFISAKPRALWVFMINIGYLHRDQRNPPL